MYVGLSFWILYLINRELILPEEIDEYFPMWLNHLEHTSIMVWIFLELIMSYRCYPPRIIGLLIALLFSVSYTIWFHIIHYYTCVWVYPFFDELSIPFRVLFIIISYLVVIVLYILGEKLNSLVNNECEDEDEDVAPENTCGSQPIVQTTHTCSANLAAGKKCQ